MRLTYWQFFTYFFQVTLDLWPPLVLRAPAEYTAPVEGSPPAVADDGIIAVPETGVSFGRFV